MKKLLLTMGLVSAMLFACGEHNNTKHDKGQKTQKCITEVSDRKAKDPSKEISKLMHNPMKCQKYVESGDINRDYLSNMIPHHEGAILSSQALLKYTKNDKLKTMANNIITTQKKEIQEFKDLLSKLKKQEVSDYAKISADAKAITDKMMSEMRKLKKTKDVDKDFLNQMIIHHQAAIDSSKEILKNSKDEEVRKAAQDIINGQEQEIKEFKDTLKSMN